MDYIVVTARGACTLPEKVVSKIKEDEEIFEKTLLILTLKGVDLNIDSGDVPRIRTFEEWKEFYLPAEQQGPRSILF